MSIQREPARLAMIQLRKVAEQQTVEPTKIPSKGLLSPKKMVKSNVNQDRKTEAARVLDIMKAVREAMSGEV
jgi:hypothetical protein